MVDFGKKLDSSAVKSVLEFLFGKKKTSKELDVSTDIRNKKFFQALTYYNILGEEFGCETAQHVGDILKRLSISTDRAGRTEGANILMQDLPKEETILRGIANSLNPKNGGES